MKQLIVNFLFVLTGNYSQENALESVTIKLMLGQQAGGF
jgi:hypothetical protein